MAARIKSQAGGTDDGAAADRISVVIKARMEGREEEDAFYSDDDITAIIDATGSEIPPDRRDKLVRRLEQAANRWIFENQMQRSPTPRKLENRFSKIERAAAKLLEEIGTGPQGALNSIPDPIIDRLQMTRRRSSALRSPRRTPSRST